jgi:hypothetical protein
MGIVYGATDTDVDAWSRNIVANGGSVSASTIYSVLTFTRNLKSSGLWAKMKEVYIFCGVTDLNSSLTKLKYITNQRITNTNIPSNYYTATGSTCGVKGDGTYMFLNPGVAYDAVPIKDRFVAAYETNRVAAFYTTLIGREKGGGNTAFGPTINPNGYSQARILDPTLNVTTSASSPVITAGGLITANVTSNSVAHYTNKTWQNSNDTIGDILGGTGGYLILSALGGGGFPLTTISLGFIGNYLNQAQTELLSNYCDILMTDFGGNK